MTNLTVPIHLVGRPVCQLHGVETHWIFLYAEQLGREFLQVRVCLQCLAAAHAEQSRFCRQINDLVAGGATRQDAVAAVKATWSAPVEDDDASLRFGLLELH